jgi:hypothetical protein
VSLPHRDRKMRTGVRPLVNGARLTNQRWSDEGASSGLGGLSPCQRSVCRGSGRVEDYGAGEDDGVEQRPSSSRHGLAAVAQLCGREGEEAAVWWASMGVNLGTSHGRREATLG